MLLNVSVFIISYLVGSFPTAYIVVKRKSNIDIRTAGSGNVGTLNAYEVTGTRFVGLVVLFVDLIKGALAVVVARFFFGPASEIVSCALVGVVVGHCFPVWLGFKGGRGLAPAAGAMLTVSWLFVALWLLCWFIGYKLSKNVHIGNIAAIVIVPVLGFFMPEDIIVRTVVGEFPVTRFLLIYGLVSAILFIRHIEPLRELISSRKKKEF